MLFNGMWKDKLCKEQRVQAQGLILVEHQRRWELDQNTEKHPQEFNPQTLQNKN